MRVFNACIGRPDRVNENALCFLNTQTPDFLVIGLGAMGSAISYQLAKQGAQVVGIDQFTPPHTLGSTHGESRITRLAIGEGRQFVPLAQRSHQLWREIEQQTGESLLHTCGGIIITPDGQPNHLHAQRDFLGNTFSAADAFGIAHERLRADEIVARYPQFVLTGNEVGYFEPTAGYLMPEACVQAQLELAKRYGASLHFGETVQNISHDEGGTVVETNRARYQAGATIVAAGAWAPQLLPTFNDKLAVRRQLLTWFALDGSVSYAPEDFPVFIWLWGTGPNDAFYGFPEIDVDGRVRAIKVAAEQNEVETTVDTIDRNVTPAEIAAMFEHHVAGKLQGVTGRCVKAATCLYTSTPTANFIIDRLPHAEDTIVVSACSGHGFKHSAAIGEAVTQMAIEKSTPAVLRPFAIPVTGVAS